MADETNGSGQPEEDSLLPAELEAVPKKRGCHLKRAGFVAVPLACALLAAALWASSAPALRPTKELLGAEYNEPVQVGQADEFPGIAEYSSNPTGTGSWYSSNSVPSNTYGVSPAKAQSARCILCNPNQCTLDYSGRGAWTSCPVHAPFFSEAHCKCVSSNTCQDASPVLPSCSLCQDCSKKPCIIEGKYLQCPPQTPHYMPSKKLCASSCQPVPGPPPPPYRPPPSPLQPGRTEITPTPMPAPIPTPYTLTTPRPTTCKEDTGGTCGMLGCSSSRGKTTCKNSKCLCDTRKGYCAQKGKCVKVGPTPTPSTNPSPSTVATCRDADTGTSCRWSDCDPKLGKTECDGMIHGLGTYKCKCKLHYCFDKSLKKCRKFT